MIFMEKIKYTCHKLMKLNYQKWTGARLDPGTFRTVNLWCDP